MTPSRRLHIHATLLACLLGLSACTTLNPEAQSAELIARAEAVLGSTALQTLTLTGRGSGGSLGQAYAPGSAWPRLEIKAWSRSMNFETAAFREEYVRSRAEPLGGGTSPPMGAGEARGLVLAREGWAWDVVGVATVPAPAAWPARMHELWLGTPQGAIQFAARHGARAGERRDFLRHWDTLSVMLPGLFSATLVLEPSGLLSHIESTLAHPVLGELPVLTRFLDYQLRGARMVPTRIVQEQGGHLTLDIQLSEVTANDAVEITVPEAVRAAGRKGSERVQVDKVADGVWFLGGGSHNSVAIEQAGQIVLVELPLHTARARAVLDAGARLVAGKPVRAVINTHHHFDHAGGLRTGAAEVATIYTSALAQPYLEAIFKSPSMPPPEAAAAAAAAGPTGSQARLVAVPSKALLDDAERPIEIHELQDSIHARGLLVVWLPRQRLLIEADAYTPAAPGTAPPATPDPNHLNLVQNLDRLGLAPRWILPLHGRVVPAAELYAQVGRKAPGSIAGR